jgi:hypothetical protein
MLTLTGEDSAADGGPEDAVTRDHSSGRQDEKVFHENNDWLGGSGSFSEERDEGNVVSLLRSRSCLFQLPGRCTHMMQLQVTS